MTNPLPIDQSHLGLHPITQPKQPLQRPRDNLPKPRNHQHKRPSLKKPPASHNITYLHRTPLFNPKPHRPIHKHPPVSIQHRNRIAHLHTPRLLEVVIEVERNDDVYTSGISDHEPEAEEVFDFEDFAEEAPVPGLLVVGPVCGVVVVQIEVGEYGAGGEGREVEVVAEGGWGCGGHGFVGWFREGVVRV